MQHDVQRAREVLGAYGLANAALSPIHMGNINGTYLVEVAATRTVLQQLNPIFKPEIHIDIAYVTAHLARAGMTTPRLIETRDGALWATDVDGGVWRLQTYVPGVVHSQATDPTLCRAAGALLGRFHLALADLGEHRFRAPRLGVHDTRRHLQALRDALAQHGRHVALDQVRPVAEAILAEAHGLPFDDSLPPRVVHGDPKLNNIVFDTAGDAVAFIDLDTLNTMPIDLEVGDALRSWCSPGGESEADTAFSLPHFKASLEGYAQTAGRFLTPAEVRQLPAALERIALELASRFARDALEERYFGWDRVRFAAAWQHNLLRARSQLSLARSYAAQRNDARRVVAALF